MHARTHAHTHARTHARTYAHTHTHTGTHPQNTGPHARGIDRHRQTEKERDRQFALITHPQYLLQLYYMNIVHRPRKERPANRYS